MKRRLIYTAVAFGLTVIVVLVGYIGQKQGWWEMELTGHSVRFSPVREQEWGSDSFEPTVLFYADTEGTAVRVSDGVSPTVPSDAGAEETEAPEKVAKKCPACGRTVGLRAFSCPYCGNAEGAFVPQVKCPACGELYDSDAPQCPACGRAS